MTKMSKDTNSGSRLGPIRKGSQRRGRFKPAIVEMHRKLLALAPVSPAVVDEWTERTKGDPRVTVDDAAEHLAQYCTPETFSQWAQCLAGSGRRSFGDYVTTVMRSAYDAASWEQKINGIFYALGCQPLPTVPRIVCEAGNLTEPVMMAIAHVSVEFHEERLAERHLKREQRALGLLGLDALAVVFAKRWNAAASKKSAEEIDALLAEIEPSPTCAVLTNPTGEAGTAQPLQDLSAVAVIVLRSRECRKVEHYLTDSRSTSIASETMYLASALTYRPVWELLFEEPVSLRCGRKLVAFDRVSGSLHEKWIEVKFTARTDSRTNPHVDIPIREGRRSFDANTLGHAALVLLNLLFSREENLTTANAQGDKVLARQWLEPTGKTPSAVYRLTDPPQWEPGDGASRLAMSVATSDRRAHDVRGHFRIVDGIAYPVKPHRRRA